MFDIAVKILFVKILIFLFKINLFYIFKSFYKLILKIKKIILIYF